VRRHYSRWTKNKSVPKARDNIQTTRRTDKNCDTGDYGHPIRSMRKAASNVELRRGAAIDENAGNVRSCDAGAFRIESPKSDA
jgi:hypothetical protein